MVRRTVHEPDEGEEPTHEQQVRKEKLLLVRLSLMRGFLPSQARLLEAMSEDELREYSISVASFSQKVSKNDLSESALRTYFQRLGEADKLHLRVTRTHRKRRGQDWHQLRDQTKEAYLRAFNELRRVLKFSPGLKERLFPQPVYLPDSALWPGHSDFPRIVRPRPHLPPFNDAKARYNFTRLYIDRLIGPDPLDVPSDQ